MQRRLHAMRQAVPVSETAMLGSLAASSSSESPSTMHWQESNEWHDSVANHSGGTNNKPGPCDDGDGNGESDPGLSPQEQLAGSGLALRTRTFRFATMSEKNPEIAVISDASTGESGTSSRLGRADRVRRASSLTMLPVDHRDWTRANAADVTQLFPRPTSGTTVRARATAYSSAWAFPLQPNPIHMTDYSWNPPVQDRMGPVAARDDLVVQDTGLAKWQVLPRTLNRLSTARIRVSMGIPGFR